MSRFLQDSGRGRAFVLSCDSCGAQITGATPGEREKQRQESGWAPSGGAVDLCANCRPKDDAPGRRFARPS